MDTQSELISSAPPPPPSSPLAADLKAQVDEIFVKQFELDAAVLLPAAGLFTDLGLDSLDAIDLMITFERELGFKPETLELQAIRTVDDVYQLVARYSERAAAAASRGA